MPRVDWLDGADPERLARMAHLALLERWGLAEPAHSRELDVLCGLRSAEEDRVDQERLARIRTAVQERRRREETP